MHLSCVSAQLQSVCRWKQFMRKQLPCCDPRRSMAWTQFLQPFGQSHSLFHAPHSIEFTKGLSLLKTSIQNKTRLFCYHKISNSRPLAKIKVFGVLPAHWIPTLCWYLFHGWSIQFSCIITAEGGGRCRTAHMVKIAVHPAEGCCTTNTMAHTSIKQQISNSAWLTTQQYILLNFPSTAFCSLFGSFSLPDIRIQDTNMRDK